ncbi:hypothetical protein [Streptomyces sp. NPDC090445]|uniref:hypothetical protein n=1 Tax=Streptomyces sp. NPDC090445 TaxID=3365963 RepID=UPI003819BB04
MNGLRLARAALRVLTGAGAGSPAQATLLARVRVHVEDRLRGTTAGTEALRRLRDEPGAPSTALATLTLADEIDQDPAFETTLRDLLEQLLGSPGAVQAYGAAPTTGIPTGAVQPAGAVQPVQPAGAVQPAGPVQPVQPAGPVQPVQPAGPVQPVQPAGPVQPVQPAGAVQPPGIPQGAAAPPGSGAGVVAAGSALGGISGLGAATAHAIPFAPADADDPPAQPPSPPTAAVPQIVVIPPLPPYPPGFGSWRSPARWVFLLGLPPFLLYVLGSVVLAALGASLFNNPLSGVWWLVSAVMALIGLIRGLFQLRGPFSALLGTGLVLNLVVLVALFLIGPPTALFQVLAGIKI